MKRSNFLFVGAALMLFGACQESKVMFEYDSQNADPSAFIEFNDYVSGITRASKSSGATFVAGDAMGVFGFQTMDENLSFLFNNQLVTNASTAADPNLWTYEPKKYWDGGSTYDFYAIYPYSATNYAFDSDARLFNVKNFTVKSEADEQTDLMIAQSVINARPFNKVNFVFNHILSNVNFYVKTSEEFDADGITSVTVLNFDITGLYGEGSYTQTSWKGSEPVGTWTADNTSVYDLPEVKNVNYVIGAAKSSLVEDLLLLPQNISDDAMVNVTYKLNYENGDESVFRRSVSLNRILGVKRTANTDTLVIASWDANYRYNYIISIDPSVTDQGGHHLAVADPDHDQQDHQDNPGAYPPTVDILLVDTDGDGTPDDYWIDEDMDGTPDYPVVWDDIDGDGKEEGMPDRDGDGQPDDSDGDGNPDVIMLDTDGDGFVDTELERDLTPSGPDIPDTPAKTPFADFNGGVDDYMHAAAYLMTDDDGEYWIDLDGDGNGDVHILWKDIDGDGLLEGIPDRDGDGLLTPADSYDNDGKDYLGNDNDYDVVLYLVENETTGEMEWKELERPDSSTGGDGPDVPDTDVPNTDHDGGYEGYKNPTTYLIKDTDGEYWIDEDGDGDGEIHVVWKNIDDDDMLEGIADKVQDGVATAADSYDNDGKDYKGNDNDYDVVLYQETPGGEWKELEKEALPAGPDLPDVTPRNADYDGKVDGYQTATADLSKDADDNYWIDINGDGVADYPVLWKNIDDDDKLEGIVDKNKDGELTPEDNFDGDGKDYKGNDNDYDVVLYIVEDKTTGEIQWVELEKDAPSVPIIPVVETSIEFSAEVSEWYDDYDAAIAISSNNE